MGLLILLALIGVPLVEIGVFIRVGDVVGLWWTLALIVATAVVGTALLRHQGLATLARARETLNRGGMPVQEVLDGVCLLVSGAFLLTPGFVTDAAGGLLLVPTIRHALQHWALARLSARRHPGPPTGGTGGDVIDGDYTELNDDNGALPPGGDRGDRR